MNRKIKIKLLQLLFSGEITRQELSLIFKTGIPAPSMFEYLSSDGTIYKKTPNYSDSIIEIYKKIGWPIFTIQFQNAAPSVDAIDEDYQNFLKQKLA